jgi:response regulator NasT
LALAYFNELKILQEENATLKETLELSKLINKAKGLLMEHEKLSEQEAFRKIQKLSMDRNKKMREVAEAVILVYEKTTIQNRPS